MIEVRLARKGEVESQKDLWKRCFGDQDQYIDFYYSNRYKEDETLLLLQDGKISAMLTMIPIKMVTPSNNIFNSSMLYAIATHPEFQNRGLATRLINFSNTFLSSMDKEISVLVPAETRLFDFYRKQGYGEGFYINEALITLDDISRMPIAEFCQCLIFSIEPYEYNKRRNHQLRGSLYIDYFEEDIHYQKKMSQLSGADIYAVNIENFKGCLTAERISQDKVIIKELLVPKEYVHLALKQIALQLPAKEYILRTPAYEGKYLGGITRPFGMIRMQKEIGVEISNDQFGYLGLAFD